MKLEPTGVSADTINHILHVFSSEPGGDFTIHTGIASDNSGDADILGLTSVLTFIHLELHMQCIG